MEAKSSARDSQGQDDVRLAQQVVALSFPSKGKAETHRCKEKEKAQENRRTAYHAEYEPQPNSEHLQRHFPPHVAGYRISFPEANSARAARGRLPLEK